MKIIEVNNINKYLVGAIPIGVGTTAICFLIPNNKVIKIYHSPLMKKFVFENMHEFDCIGNDTYISPSEFLVKDNLCVAQIYDYVKAKTLHSSNKLKISEIIKAYDKLYQDTIKISEKGFFLCDLHDKNILFNGNFYIIDLDKGYIDEEKMSYLFNINMRNINQVILYFIFKIKEYQILQFYDEKLNILYSKSLSEPYEFIYLLNEIMNYTDDGTVKTLNKKIKYDQIYNPYYKF